MKKIRKGLFDMCISETQVDSQRDAQMIKFWDWYQKDWELDTFKIFDKFLNKEHDYMDIGAWIGPTVLYGANLSRKCYCYEPDRLAFKYLTNNISENPNLKDKVKAFDFGVSNKNSSETFYVGEGSTSMSSLEPIWNKSLSYNIDVYDFQTTIEKSEIDFKSINFIKIDIEGGEYKLIPSLISYIKKEQHYPTLYISLHASFTFSTVWKKSILHKLIAYVPKKVLARKMNKKILKEIYSVYKNIYLKNGKLLKHVNELGDARAFSEIIATNLTIDETF